MDFDLLIPITLFICIAYAVKALAESYTLRRLLQSHGSEDLLRELLEAHHKRRRQSALHWGCVSIPLAMGFGLVDLTGITQVTPGAIALILGSVGLGNLAYFFIEKRAR